MTINSSSIPALRVARAVRRRKRAEGGGIFDYSGVGEALPESYSQKSPISIPDPALALGKRMIWDLPHEAIDAANRAPAPGLRREDYTDAPAYGAPDPTSMTSRVGMSIPTKAPSPLDEMIGPSLETATNVMGGTALSAPARAAGEFVAGAGPVRRAGATALDDVDQVVAAERNLKGPQHGQPEPAVDPAAAAPPGDVGGGLAGSTGGRGGLAEAPGTAARWAGQRSPVEGLPVKPQYIEGHGYLQPGPIGRIHDVAEEYMRTHRPEIEYAPPAKYSAIDPEHSQAVAKAFDEMKHSPKDPATKASYDAMIDETHKQYNAIKATGLKIEPIPAGHPDPYAANPRLAAHDVAENNHLWFFPTEGGFGTVNKISDNPLLRKTGEKIGDHELLANDMFRVVHDYFGHLKEGYGFRAAGEDNAWRSHSAMYSDLARPAMTSETRGQNSWVNYGPHGEKNRTASGSDTVYADQKIGLMPEWTMRDRGSQPPIITHHGSPHSFDRFNLDKVRTGEGANVYGEGVYLAQEPKVAKAYRDTLSKHGMWTRNGQQVPWDAMSDDIVRTAYDSGSGEHAGLMAHRIMSGLEAGKSLKAIRRNFEVPEGADAQWAAALRAAEPYAFTKNKGHMYDVAVDADPQHFLDWDKTLKGQTPFVGERVAPHIEQSVANQRAALEKKIDKIRSGGGMYASGDAGKVRRVRDLEEAQRALTTLSAPDETGRGIYRRMGLPAVSQEEGYTQSRHALKNLGVPGIKYLDQGSRGATTSGTRNFVVFDDKLLRILRKYGVVGVPAAGVLGADGEERRARGGKVRRRKRRAGGGSAAFGVMSPAEEADLDEPAPVTIGRAAYRGLDDLAKRSFESSESMRQGGDYDPAPLVEAATIPMGTGAIAGVKAVGRDMVLGAGPVRRIADDTGSAVYAPRKVKGPQYAEHEYNSAGNPIINKGVNAPADPTVQTVADPYRMMFPGVYRNPRVVADEAAARVGPEDPAMKQLFGVNRGDLREMAQGRVGNQEPDLRLSSRSRGSISAQNIQTPQNTQRLQDILSEAGKHEGLRTADAWYIMDPVYKRMAELHGPEAAERYRKFNTTTAMASPGSDVMTEIQRGTGAHWLQNEGRFADFKKYAGVPEEFRSRTPGFPSDMRYIGGHPYHRTAQSDPMQKYFDAGSIQSNSPKVPLYAHASGVPETGFQTKGPVGDAHFSRGVGLSDTRKGPTDVQGSFSTAEYQTLQPWWQHDVAGKVGMESVPAQARLWTALGPQTGVDSALGAPKLELLAKQIMVTAKRLRISPEQARDLVLSGKAGAGLVAGAIAAPAVRDAMEERAAGGSVNTALNVARSIRRAKGGRVHLGPIVGDTDGRADKVPMHVPDGSYVLTADHCSAMGEGNTLAGFQKLKKMFPKSVAAYKAAKANPVQRASGGHVPILAADGEFVICPEDITDRFGDLDHGHKVLDQWQTTERKNHIATLSKLAPPAQD